MTVLWWGLFGLFVPLALGLLCYWLGYRDGHEAGKYEGDAEGWLRCYDTLYDPLLEKWERSLGRSPAQRVEVFDHLVDPDEP